MANRKGESVNDSWGTDHDGRPCTKPEKIISEGGLMPLGGPEITSNYTIHPASFMFTHNAVNSLIQRRSEFLQLMLNTVLL